LLIWRWVCRVCLRNWIGRIRLSRSRNDTRGSIIRWLLAQFRRNRERFAIALDFDVDLLVQLRLRDERAKLWEISHLPSEIGRASCRERGWISVVSGQLEADR